MKYIASVKVKGTNEIKVVESTEFEQINTKAEFAKVLRDSDYAVRFITTEENFDTDCENYYAKLEHARSLRKHIKEATKETANRMEESKVVEVTEVEEVAAEVVTVVEGLVNITEYHLHWNNPLNAPKILTLGQIKELYGKGNFLFDNDLRSPITFQEASIKIVSNVVCAR